MISRIGSRAPAYCTAVGKALLSELPTEQVLELLKRIPLEKRTEMTITDPIKLLEELRITKERGYAVDNEEHEEGIKCYAALIRDYGGDVAGAISITGLCREFDRTEELKKPRTTLIKIAAEISRALGYANKERD
ncbi:hypothetical protein B5M50_05905 [candidate division KSB1 bacterium 4484_219]|nr:MAG: hypothetical protein B5M50_05905 [candidate division KSB1 bacterium 4484_219]